MVEKLRLVLKNPIYQSASRAVVFALFLSWFNSVSTVLAAVFFVGAAAWLYFRPLFNSFNFFITWGILLIVSFWTVSLTRGVWSWLAVLALAALFFILVSVKNLVFVERKKWHFFLDMLLLYIVFIDFFLINKSDLFSVKWLLALIVIYLLLKDLFRELPKSGLFALVAVLLLGQLSWVVGWLPIGFLSSANLMILTTFLIINLVFKRRLIVRDILLFSGLLLIVLATSSWSV